MGAASGRYVETIVGGERVRAFVPDPLPPMGLDLGPLLVPLSRAERAIGRLDGITSLLPEEELFLYMYVRKEAVVSSQIEGTQSTLSDLLRFETEAQAGKPFDDVREVSNYVDAMMHGLERMSGEAGLPLSMRLLKELHARLLKDGRGMEKNPGEVRRSQNWIGGERPGKATFVPPPVNEVDACLNNLERFIHERAELPALVKAGLLHVQFETVHPFLDGNGRIGRLLVTLYLCSEGVLRRPLLYLSLYFKTHRQDYYRLLQEVREQGAWGPWLEFFLEGVRETAEQAFEAATRIVDLFRRDRARIQEDGATRASSALRVHAIMERHPYVSNKQLVEHTNLTPPTVNTALEELERMEIVAEVTGRKRGRIFGYTEYLKILNEGTGMPSSGAGVLLDPRVEDAR